MNTAQNYTSIKDLTYHSSYKYNKKYVDIDKRFEVHSLEWMESQLLLNCDPEKLERFEILWIKKGEGVLWIDQLRFETSDNTIYCFAPGGVRKYNFEAGIEGHYISFTPEFLWLSEEYSENSSWLEHYTDVYNLATVKVEDDYSHEIDIIIRKMKWELNNYFNLKLELLKGLLNILLIYFSRNLKEPEHKIIQTRESELVRKFIKSVKKNFITQKLVIDYAEQLCVTPNYLNRTVKNLTGYTASHYIQQQIILEAKRKAIFSSVTMKEIAYSLGFDNLAHFSKFFKNNCGMSFTDYKKTTLRPG